MSRVNPLNLLLVFLLSAVILLAGLQYLYPKPSASNMEAFAQFIRHNPQLIAESLEHYYSRDAGASSAKNAVPQPVYASLSNNPDMPMLGDPKDGKVVIEIFDYQCGYCKKAHSILLEVQKERPDVAFKFYPYPVLSEFSRYLSQVALAVYHVHGAERFLEVHTRFLNPIAPALRNKEDVANAMEALRIEGWEEEADKKKYQAMLERNLELGTELHFSGVPTFILDGKLYPGMLNKQQLLEKLS